MAPEVAGSSPVRRPRFYDIFLLRQDEDLRSRRQTSSLRVMLDAPYKDVSMET